MPVRGSIVTGRGIKFFNEFTIPEAERFSTPHGCQSLVVYGIPVPWRALADSVVAGTTASRIGFPSSFPLVETKLSICAQAGLVQPGHRPTQQRAGQTTQVPLVESLCGRPGLASATGCTPLKFPPGGRVPRPLRPLPDLHKSQAVARGPEASPRPPLQPRPKGERPGPGGRPAHKRIERVPAGRPAVLPARPQSMGTHRVAAQAPGRSGAVRASSARRRQSPLTFLETLRPGANASAQALGGRLQAPRTPHAWPVFGTARPPGVPALGPPGAAVTKALSAFHRAGEQDPGRQNVRADDEEVQSTLRVRPPS
ncbi:hypothetical protein NDU88_000672 [Pleurodeles waltl]|uniref:Uncharacterized protein n=1 Tax=Pleurodeles waltl TaxID=8319 RepID=A0AAV7S7N0_PLEWA|nr:hypothetical protein NDU88_000672 [Pleurodeles waltl]